MSKKQNSKNHQPFKVKETSSATFTSIVPLKCEILKASLKINQQIPFQHSPTNRICCIKFRESIFEDEVYMKEKRIRKIFQLLSFMLIKTDGIACFIKKWKSSFICPHKCGEKIFVFIGTEKNLDEREVVQIM